MANSSRRDYYEILGVSRDADAVALKRAYRTLALRYHPDQNQNDKDAEEKFKEVSAAYAVLSDPEKRLRYERLGHVGLQTTGGDVGVPLDLESFKQFFESIFGDLIGRRRGRSGGRDMRYTLEISLREAALGAQKPISFPVRSDCPSCQGTGGRGGEAGLRTCRTCAGKGEIKAPGFFSFAKSCTVCSGTGKEIMDACPDCRGSGTVERVREFSVNVAPGTEDGSLKRLPGQGEPGRRGGPIGDLTVILKIKPHPLIKREAALLLCDVPITFAEAALGCTVDVPTLEGRVEMKIPPGTQSGAVFRLRGKGFPLALNATQRGDLHVKVLVETPLSLDDAQRARLRAMVQDLPKSAHPQKKRYLEQLELVQAESAGTTIATADASSTGSGAAGPKSSGRKPSA